jgi:hypothetical protein
VDVRERQRELRHQRRQPEIGSVLPGEAPCQPYFRSRQEAVPLLTSGVSTLPPSAERTQRPPCLAIVQQWTRKIMAIEGL